MHTRCIVAFFLAAILLCSCLPGLAEPQCSQIEEVYSIECSRYSDVLIIEKHNEDGNLFSYLASTDGTALSDKYEYISEDPFYPLYTVEAIEPEDPVHCKGLINPDGSVLIPLMYVDTKIISSRWVAAFRIVPSTADNYDYYTIWGTRKYYIIDTVDIYYCGQLAGTLNREDYIFANGYGDYLCVQNREGNYTFYNKSFEKSPFRASRSGEYSSDRRKDKIYYHQGSGVQAFCEGCPLSADEVDACYLADHEIIYDLQGNVVCRLKEGCETYYTNPSRFAKVKLDDKYGVVDILTGEEVIPIEFDSNLDFYDSADHNDGYAIVEKDGMFGYVRSGGEVICDFVYPYDDVHKEGMVSTVDDPEGGVTVITAAAGILPERYQSILTNEKERAFIAEKADGQQAVIGLNGKELIPFGNYSRISVNYDATVAVTQDSEGEYLVWTMDYEDTINY